MQGVNVYSVPFLRVSALQILEFNVPFCLGETCHYFKQCDLFHSFHAFVEVQFGGLAQLDRAANNYKDSLNSLYRHPDLTLTIDKVLHNIIVSAYSHYIDSWPMNGASMGHHTILMRSMLQFTMHYGRYRHRQQHLAKDRKRKGLSSLAPMPPMDLATLLDEEEENLKLRQINMMHASIMDLLGNPGNPLYAEPHSMAEHYDAMLAGTCALGNLPERTHCRDSGAMARVHEDKAQQVCQKILRCLDMRVMDSDLVVPTCLRMPTLILPARRFVQLYYGQDAQGQYASHFPTGGQGFLQPRGDIRMSIVPRNFRILPADVREVVELYFHREGLEVEKNQESDDCMSTDMEAANTVRCLQLHCLVAMASLQMAVREALAPATAARPQEEYHYDSDDSVLNLDEEYLDLAERVMHWWAACQSAACAPPWQPSDFGRPEQSHFNKLPDLRELLNQAKEARACKWVPIQSVALTPLPLASIRDLDRQRQQRHDQTMAKHQSSPLDGEQRKRAKTLPQPDPYDAPDVGHGRAEQNQSQDHGRLRTRVDQQLELDRTHSKSRKRSKSCRRSKSRKRSKSRRRSKSHKRDGGREYDKHEPHRPGVWPSQHEREVPNRSPRSTTQKDVRGAGHSALSNDLSKFLKLKDEVLKNAQSYIRRHATIIFCTLSPNHEAVKCLLAFSDQAQKFAAEVLATIEWGTQHWKLQETFPVPVIPRWLRMPEFTQTTTPLRGELPLMPTGGHFEDIRVRCPAMWSWMTVLLQYWQDHMTPHLYRGRFCCISDLAATVIRDINPWLPHQVCFGWGYVAMNAMLWIDQRDHFSVEHLEEWAKQKEQECALNDLERDTEVVYRARIIRMQEDKILANSKEAAAKDLPPERRVAHVERQAGATPRKDCVSSTSMSATLYPDWVLSQAGKRTSPNTPQPYQTPREDAGG